MILLYHHVADAEDVTPERLRDAHGGWECVASPSSLRFHLRELQRRGFRFLPLDELVSTIERTGREPGDAVAVTFDDGWSDQYENAYPILSDLGCPATFFVTTEHLRTGVPDRRRMSVDQLRTLAQAGMLIGGHTRTHPDLTRIPHPRAVEEIVGCKADLESALGHAVKHFAYPGGAFDAHIAGAVEEAGFESACSVLGPHRNTVSSLMWLYRDAFTDSMRSPRDLYRLSPVARRLFEFRVDRRLARRLVGVSEAAAAGTSAQGTRE